MSLGKVLSSWLLTLNARDKHKLKNVHLSSLLSHHQVKIPWKFLPFGILNLIYFCFIVLLLCQPTQEICSPIIIISCFSTLLSSCYVNLFNRYVLPLFLKRKWGESLYHSWKGWNGLCVSSFIFSKRKWAGSWRYTLAQSNSLMHLMGLYFHWWFWN